MHLPLFVAKHKTSGGQSLVRRTDVQTERTSRSASTEYVRRTGCPSSSLLLASVKEREANIQLSQLFILHTIVTMRCEDKSYLEVATGVSAIGERGMAINQAACCSN